MDTNYNPYAQIVLEMKLELEEMEKKYSDLLNIAYISPSINGEY